MLDPKRPIREADIIRSSSLQGRRGFACWLRGYEKRGLNLLCITVGANFNRPGYSAAIGMGIGPRPI